MFENTGKQEVKALIIRPLYSSTVMHQRLEHSEDLLLLSRFSMFVSIW